MFAALNIILPRTGLPGGNPISYLSFFHGAALFFFLLAIASWCRTAKSGSSRANRGRPDEEGWCLSKRTL